MRIESFRLDFYRSRANAICVILGLEYDLMRWDDLKTLPSATEGYESMAEFN